MTKEEFKPVQIGYNKRGCNDKLYRLRNSIEKLNTYKIDFENIGLVWDMDTLMDFLANGSIESENRILNMISQEVERCAFPSRKEALERELNNTIYHSFKQLKAYIKSTKPDCDPRYLEMVGSSVCLSSEGQKAIEDSFIIYANTPDELEIWNEACELVERLKNVDIRLRPFGIYAIAQWDFDRPALIRVSESKPIADYFMIEYCNNSSIWRGKRIN